MIDLSSIVPDSIVDGPGIRVTIFCQGCPHRCKGCHNPKTWKFGSGTPTSVERIVEIVRQSPLARGVTFSGGEPFSQAAGYAKLARLLKAQGYEVASYSGYTFEEILAGDDDQRALLKELDVLIDGRFVLEERSLDTPFRGSRNQRLINVQESLKTGIPVEITTGRWVGQY
ncbi:MAG: anaerobic ribonucleoside-triphosphate reductase activating protein [Burkholderiaceae bacterium]|nr:anaerobic ribonucleoside-triphosphate reductase activating protein [Burkholderiaceae bacterium]